MLSREVIVARGKLVFIKQSITQYDHLSTTFKVEITELVGAWDINIKVGEILEVESGNFKDIRELDIPLGSTAVVKQMIEDHSSSAKPRYFYSFDVEIYAPIIRRINTFSFYVHRCIDADINFECPHYLSICFGSGQICRHPVLYIQGCNICSSWSFQQVKSKSLKFGRNFIRRFKELI